MELKIYDELAKYYCNMKIKVDYIKLRTYKLSLELETSNYEFIYIWDGKMTFEVNIDIIIKEIDKCILKYYHRI